MPIPSATGADQSASSYAVAPWATAPTQRTDRAFSSTMAGAVGNDVTTGTRKSEPAAERTTLGAVTSTERGPAKTAHAPAASATRTIVPTLPGSATPSSTIAGPRSNATSSIVAGCHATTASAACGDTVVATPSKVLASST